MELSDREVKVLAGLGQGLSVSEVAGRLQLSQRTVMYSLAHLRKKVEIRVNEPVVNTVSLTVKSAELGIFPFGWRLSQSGTLVKSVEAVTRASLGLAPKQA